MLWRSIGDSSEAAQIAKPRHGIDAIGHAAHDSTAQYSAPGVAPEVSLHQRFSHAREGDGLDREGQKRRHALKRCDMLVLEPGRGLSCPRRIDAIHLPNAAVGRKAIDDGNLVGESVGAHTGQHIEFGFVRRRNAAS